MWPSDVRFLRDAKGHFSLLKKLEIRVDTNAHNEIEAVTVFHGAPHPYMAIRLVVTDHC